MDVLLNFERYNLLQPGLFGLKIKKAKTLSVGL